MRLHCRRFRLSATDLRCSDGRLKAKFAGQPLTARLDAELDFTADSGTLALTELDFAGGSGELRSEYSAQDWRLQLKLTGLPAAAVPANLSLAKTAGTLTLNATVSGPPVAADFTLQGRALQFANDAGTLAGEGLQARLDGSWRAPERFEFTLAVDTGQFYLDPLFVAADRPLRLSAAGRLGERRLNVERLRYRHPETLSVDGSLTLNRHPPSLQRAAVRFDARLPAAFAGYAQPLLTQTWTTAGRLQGDVNWRTAGPHYLALTATDLEIAQTALKFDGLNGELRWTRAAEPQTGRLRWASGRLYRLAVGPAQLRFSSHGGTLRLAAPARLPLLDGALALTALRAEHTETGVDWQLAGRLEPISMPALSAALGWPSLAGTLAGVVPDVRYASAERRLDLGGALLIKAFGGDVTVAELSLERPLGPSTRLQAKVGLERLNLATLTETFDIGRIQGQLNGLVEDLELLDWRPVSFVARFYTPADDPLPHRISQRAVETISALGGNDIGSVLSRGFLGLFDEFRYRRLGLACRLSNQVCILDGVAPAADGGFIIVEGSGLPRIDVIGYNRRVDWPELLARVQAAIASGGPVVK